MRKTEGGSLGEIEIRLTLWGGKRSPIAASKRVVLRGENNAEKRLDQLPRKLTGRGMVDQVKEAARGRTLATLVGTHSDWGWT